jgi:acyl-coenzyme A synthetase/AMP-(fatty) acid ligase
LNLPSSACPTPISAKGVVGVIVPEKGRPPAKSHHGVASRTEGRALQAAQEDLVLDELPRNTMGKVQKNILREKAALYADCLLRWRCLLQPGWLL